jgi:hypothetical protein
MKTLRSAALAPTFAIFTAFVALGTSGCFLQLAGPPPDSTSGAPSGTSTPTVPPPGAGALRVDIDPGVTVSSTPGQQVGVYVEDTGGGHWNVFTTCDTSKSGGSCNFDMNVSPEAGATFSGVGEAHLAYGDAMTMLDDGTIQLVARTTYEATGISFDTTPGALIQVNVLLDGVPQSGLVHWVERGVLQDGAPSNPVQFIPTAP